MHRRYSRSHQILKNAGVIHSSDEETNDPDIIENTPNASPEHCGIQTATTTGRKFDAKRIDASPPTHEQTNKASETNIKTLAYSSLIQKRICEVGETSIEAPVLSPLTPNQLMYQIGEISIEAPAYSPLTPRQINQITEGSIEVPDFSPLPTIISSIAEKSTNTNNPSVSPVSSPLPCMSPATSKFFNAFIIDSDDSVKDPNFEVEYSDDLSDSILDEHKDYVLDKSVAKKKRSKNTESPSILTTTLENSDLQNEDNNDLVRVPSENRDEQILEDINSGPNPKKRKVRNPTTWKINLEKQKRLRGEIYETKKTKTMQARPIKLAQCSTISKHKCISYVPQYERIKIYNTFRNLPSLQEQRHFIINHVTKNKKNRDTTRGNSRRKFTLIYTLTVAQEKKVVCREFFLDTLNITGGFVKGALKKMNEEGLLLPDKRGKKAPPNKFNPEDEKFIRDHILSFPAVESHYCRRDSVIRYLDSTLNITIMYKEYKKICESKAIRIACLEKYRSIFREYKLSFHKPKKDLCKHCLAFKEMNDEEKAKVQESHRMHLTRRDEARKCRDEDKEEAKNDDKILSFNFDLEAVLSTPKGAAGPFFYVRKLAVYNLTIYNLGSQDVECFMWDETEGKRGSIEISTCINAYILANNNIKHVRMMSDGCGGQQKNYHFSSMCLMTLKQHSTLQIIDHKFFETGHTHMECDSVHSKVEQKSKNIPVYTPDGWIQVVRMARTNPRPYKVKSLLHDDFKDFGNQNQFQATVSDEGRKLLISDAVWLRYKKEVPDTIFLKTSFDKNAPFATLQLKKKRGKVVNYPISVYSQRHKISSKKKNDLLKLCTDYQIPRLYHSFYNDLPCSESVKDRLPEPDIAEDSQ